MSRDSFAGPQLRGSIAAALKDHGRWEGRRGPLKMRIEKVAQPILTGEYIKYTARIGRAKAVKGMAATGTDAIRELEAIWNKIPAQEKEPHAATE